MLREIFRTVPIPYRTGSPPSFNYLPSQVPPYLESLQSIQGIHVGRNPETETGLDGATSIYLWAQLFTAEWPGVGHGYFRFDGKSGKFLRRVFGAFEGVASLIIMSRVMTSRKGAPYTINAFQDTMYKITLGKSINEPIGEELEEPIETWGIVNEGSTTGGVLQGVVGYPCTRLGLTLYGLTAFDDLQNIFINTQFKTLSVYEWLTGQLRYSITLPQGALATALEEDQHMYILLQDRTVLLFDYMRNEVLGASRIPPLPGGSAITAIGIKIGYDSVYKRMLVLEPTPNATTGACTTVIRGYRMVPEPVRLTRPIPLKVPRQRRIIPVLVQAVGDSNEGVGGYVVNAAVGGSGSLVGIPISDNMGNALIHVACEGSSLFVGAEDWETTGSPDAVPPHCGLVTIDANVTVYLPDPQSLPTSGVGTAIPRPPGGTPGQPGGGLGETAPNMLYILQQVFDAGSPRGPWQFTMGNAYDQTEIDGRGAFMEKAVQAIHDVDARFGHIRKDPGQNQYNGHAVDALVFKNDDGVTGEAFDVIGTTITWGFIIRDTVALSKWYYPA